VEGSFSKAIVRMPSPTLADGLTTSDLGRADYALFLQQHLSYTAVLRSLDLEILKLPSLPDFPDAHFVEDVAVITPEVAIIARPGAAERRGEIEHIRDILADIRPLAAIEEPGTLDGGDVMQIEQIVYVGLSDRTNEEGAKQLADILTPHGYEVHAITLVEGLHLKSNVNFIGRNTLLLTEAWAAHPLFAAYEKIIVPAEEAYVANTLLVKNRLLTPMGFPETHAMLREAGFEILEIDATEIQKLDGGLSCMSLRFSELKDVDQHG
jgi:dimethylargininase